MCIITSELDCKQFAGHMRLIEGESYTWYFLTFTATFELFQCLVYT